MKARKQMSAKLTAQPAVAKALGIVRAPVPTIRLNMYTSPTCRGSNATLNIGAHVNGTQKASSTRAQQQQQQHNQRWTGENYWSETSGSSQHVLHKHSVKTEEELSGTVRHGGDSMVVWSWFTGITDQQNHE